MNLAIALTVILVWAATGIYCYLASRHRRHDQEAWNQFRYAHTDADINWNLDDLTN